MAMPKVVEVEFAAHEQERVSALYLSPTQAFAAYVFAHGAGAGMRHPFMESLAQALAARDVATLRFQFPSMQKGLKRPDTPATAQATVRSAVAEAARYAGRVPLFAGGKSFGGRMTSQAQAGEPVPGVAGLIFLGFPLHPAGQPSLKRAEHLACVKTPMLFLQGTRDALADLALMRSVVDRLGVLASLVLFEDADHSFMVRKSSGAPRDVVPLLADAISAWIRQRLDAT